MCHVSGPATAWGKDPIVAPTRRGKTTRLKSMLLRTNFIQGLGGGFLERLLIHLASSVENISLSLHKNADTVRLIRTTRNQRKWLLTSNEAFLLHSLTCAQRKLPGAIAEVGVFEGGSARMICESKGDVPLHLFDTFSITGYRDQRFAEMVNSVLGTHRGFSVWGYR